jgi:hypothetical protein
MIRLPDKNLEKTFSYDRERLAKTEVPIVTVAGTFREDLKRLYGLPNNNKNQDVVFSRAHFSMALAIANEVWDGKINPKKAWLVDPTNYVSVGDWQKILFTEIVGKTIARHTILHTLKSFIDKFGRQKLPILESITPPLLYLTEDVEQPILSLHIASGNILAKQGKTVVQVVTDPHVRPEYVQNAHLENMFFCVFDERTQLEFLEVAALNQVMADPNRVIVTGSPIDPRIISARKNKTPWRSGPLKLCISTGGLGTNSYEIRQILNQLLPHLRREPCPYQVVLYAGTQHDIAKLGHDLAEENHIPIGDVLRNNARFRIAYHPQILDANELLIKHIFPWADGFVTKPSGDMAYDAVAAGCFLLTLSEWGIWEERIREIFEQKDISRRAETEQFVTQLTLLQQTIRGKSWIENAMLDALKIEKSFLNGNKKILKVVELARKTSTADSK